MRKLINRLLQSGHHNKKETDPLLELDKPDTEEPVNPDPQPADAAPEKATAPLPVESFNEESEIDDRSKEDTKPFTINK